MSEEQYDPGTQELPSAEVCLETIRDITARMGHMVPGSSAFYAQLIRLDAWMIGLRAAHNRARRRG